MKTNYFFKIFTLFLSVAIVASCSKSSDNDNDPGGATGLTSLAITSNVQSAVIEDATPFFFTVTGNDNVNYASSSTFFVNGAQITTSNYTATAVGSYEVYATRGDLTSNTITLQATSSVSSISVSTSPEGLVFAGNDITFTALDNLNVDISSSSTFYVDGAAITGNVFNTNVLGTHNVYAIYQSPSGEDLQSEAVDFEVVEPRVYSQKVLVEDYTGTWCGFCPRLAYNLEQAEMQDDRVIGVGIHSGDVMETSYTAPLEAEYGINSWPNGRINRNINWNESIAQVLSYVDDTADLGLAINSTLNGSTLNVEVKVGYNENASSNKLVIYLLEDGLLYDQRNYMNDDASSPWFQAGDPIPNFQHENVLREAFTDIFGDVLPDSQAGIDYSNSYSMSIPASVQNNANLEIVAFVLGSNGTAINVQHAAIGENKDFD